MARSARRERLLLPAVAVAAALAGAGFRLWHVLAEPLWLDEAYSAFAAAHGFGFLWRVVPRYETHPPFYYTLLHLWTLTFGDGLPALRLPGLIAGVGTPLALAWSADGAARLMGWEDRRRRRLIVAAFALACLSIPLVEMARQVRPYPLMILIYASALRALIALAARRRAGRPLGGGAFAGYLAGVALMLWLHNLGPPWAAALGLAMIAAIAGTKLDRRDWAWLAGGHLAVLLVYLPALGILRDQAPTWVGSTWLTFSWHGLWPKLAVLYAVPGWQSVAAGLLALLALDALRHARDGRRLAAMLLILALVPAALAIALSLAVAPVFLTRAMAPVAAPTLLLLAIGAAAGRPRAAWIGPAAAAMLAANLIAVDLQARARGPMQDWYGTVAWLAKRVRPGDAIYAYPNEGALPLARALRDRRLAWPIRAIPAPVPASDPAGWYPTGNRGAVSLPAARLREIAGASETRAVPTIWLLRLGADGYDKGDASVRAFARGRRFVRRWRDGPIDVIGLRRADLTLPPAPAPYRR